MSVVLKTIFRFTEIVKKRKMSKESLIFKLKIKFLAS